MMHIENDEIKEQLLQLEQKYYDFFGQDMPTYFMISKNNSELLIDDVELKKLIKLVEECISNITPFKTDYPIDELLY